MKRAMKLGLHFFAALLACVLLFTACTINTEPQFPNDTVADTTADSQDASAPENTSSNDADTALEDKATATVWVSISGKKYHSKPTCSNMKSPGQISLEDAQKQGYEPCKKCN